MIRVFWNLLFLCIISACLGKPESVSEAIHHSKLPYSFNIDPKKTFDTHDSDITDLDSIKNILNQYYKTVWEDGNLSGGILVAKGNRILLERYRGFGREAQQMPINQNTPMHIASVSKTMTAMVILKLIEAKKLDLNQKITHFFPNFPYPEVSIQHLLKQRSGLPKYEYFIEHLPKNEPILKKDFLSNQDILDLLITHKPPMARPADTGFMYCNTNFALLALIIEHITQMPFPEAMHEILFLPLNMSHTFVFTEKEIPTAAQSFYYKGNRLYPLNHLDLIYGDKNVYTTPRDLLKFSQAMFSPQFLPKELMQQVFLPYSNEKKGINNYGLGFRLKVFDNGEVLTYHNGWWHGSNSVFVHLRKSKTTIIAIGNKYSRHIYSALSLSGLFEDFPMETENLIKTIDSVNNVHP